MVDMFRRCRENSRLEISISITCDNIWIKIIWYIWIRRIIKVSKISMFKTKRMVIFILK
jgi:hypothetical protein